MTLSNLTAEYAERVYNILLSFYPLRFRMRFGPEMAQVFRDCCHDALEKGQVAVLVAFWLRTTVDLFSSITRERRRELMGPLDSEHPLVGLVDLLLIPSMVTANLVALGPIITMMLQGRMGISMDQFVVTSAFISFSIGVLTILASIVITKLRPTVRLWVKLS